MPAGVRGSLCLPNFISGTLGNRFGISVKLLAKMKQKIWTVSNLIFFIFLVSLEEYERAREKTILRGWEKTHQIFVSELDKDESASCSYDRCGRASMWALDLTEQCWQVGVPWEVSRGQIARSEAVPTRMMDSFLPWKQGAYSRQPHFEFRVYGTFCHFNFIYNCADLHITKFILSKTGFEFGHSKL